MIIKYNGPKKVKVLKFNTANRGTIEYMFMPTCEVTDTDALRFLLHPERKGLFEVFEEESKPVPAKTKTEEDPKDAKEEKPKRGRKPKDAKEE